MAVHVATGGDLDWILDLFRQRREALVPHAPVFWQPAPDARGRSGEFLRFLLADGGAHAYRTDNAALIAAPRGEGWLVDDAHVRNGDWDRPDATELWAAFAADCAGAQVRMVCPTYERQRCGFAERMGLQIAESWWLLECDTGGGEAGLEVALPGADALTVAAPPVYDPPGPILFLPAPQDARTAVPVAIQRADELGCAAVVVNQAAHDATLAATLAASGLRRHCDYFTGTIRTP